MSSYTYPFDEDKLVRVPAILGERKRTLIVKALIDTGADCIFIDSSLADYLELKKLETLDVGAAGGALTVERTNLDFVSVVSEDFKEEITQENFETFIVKNLGEEVVIGNSFFQGNCKLIFDYVKMQLTIEGNWEALRYE